MKAEIIKLEIKKIRPIMFLVLSLIFAIILINLCFSDKKKKENEQTVREYIKVLQKMNPDETSVFLENELTDLKNIIDKREKIREEYSFGKISFEEFHSYNIKLKDAEEKAGACEEMLDKSRYFDTQRKKGKNTEFFYDFNLSLFLSVYSGRDIFFPAFFSLLAIISAVHDIVFRSSEMIYTTIKGGRHVIIIRFIITEAVGLLASFLMFVCQGVVFYAKGYVEYMNKHICSITGLGENAGNETIIKYMLLIFVRKTLVLFLVISLAFFVTEAIMKVSTKR